MCLLGFHQQHEVCAAAPEIEKYVERLVSRGRWHVPKYRVRSSNQFHLTLLSNKLYRRKLEIWPLCNHVRSFPSECVLEYPYRAISLPRLVHSHCFRFSFSLSVYVHHFYKDLQLFVSIKDLLHSVIPAQTKSRNLPPLPHISYHPKSPSRPSKFER